jgi:predicted nucleic acid-binding protein
VELADTSAWICARRPGTPQEVREEFERQLTNGRIAVCDAVVFELLYTTRSAAEFRERRAELSMLPQCPLNTATWDRAMNVFQLLAESGALHHRQAKLPDLLIAAAAEQFGCAVLHYDQDFEAIAAVTGQEARWLAPRCTL